MVIPFHISIAVSDLAKTQEFYHGLLGCPIGRSIHNWIDFDFFGHQLTAQLAPKRVVPHDQEWQGERKFPVRHFGAVLPLATWNSFKTKLESSDAVWLIKPNVFFEGEVNEQYCMFIQDPDGYAIEFKAFENPENMFREK